MKYLALAVMALTIAVGVRAQDAKVIALSDKPPCHGTGIVALHADIKAGRLKLPKTLRTAAVLPGWTVG